MSDVKPDPISEHLALVLDVDDLVEAHRLAVGTFVGASELAAASDDPPEVLRQRVTSKGGTTYAAILSMEQDDLKNAFMRALHAARHRAAELGDEFGS